MHRLQLLGTIDLRDEAGEEVKAILTQPKRVALLTYLAAAQPMGQHRRDTLLALFWPELDEDRARHALSKGIHFLRQHLGQTAIVTRTTDEVGIDPRSIWVDAREFHRAIQEQRHEEALALYRGDLLPAFYIPRARGFEEWLDRERGGLRVHAARSARLLAERLADARSTTGALDSARRALELSDGDERTLRQVVSLLHRLGDRAGALRAYDRFRARLEEEVGGKPSAETVALMDQIRRTAPAATPPPPASTAAPPTPQATARPLDLFTTAIADRYEVEGTLGAGGSAMVLLALDLRHQRRVAIKLLRPELSAPDNAARFRGEIFIAAGLNHPHVVPLHDSGEAAGFLYYVMPWQAGESLRDRITREAPLPIVEAVRIAKEVADGLTAAHDRGIVHRDIKPENILLGADHAQLADFGIARALDDRAGIPSTWDTGGTGTPAYVSPEQARGAKDLDIRSDVYALGCVLYEMIAGRAPFESDTVEGLLALHQFTDATPLAQLRPDVPPPLAALVARTLSKHPHERPGGARELLHALTAFATHTTSAARWRWTAAGAGVTLLGALGVWVITRPAPPLPEDRPQLVIANVEAGTDSVTALGLSEALRNHLVGSHYYQVVPPQRVGAVLRLMGRSPTAWVDASTAREIAIRDGIPMMVTVRARHVEDRHLLTAELTDPDGSELGAVSVQADDLLEGIRRLAQQIRELAGDRSGDSDDRSSLPGVTTRSLEALRAYTLATTKILPTPAGTTPISLLEQAVALDPTFASANRVLSIRYLQSRRFAAGRRAFAAAMQHRDRLSEVERGLLDATAANQSGWPDTAAHREALDRVLALDPQNSTALLNRGSYETWHQVPAKGEAFAARALLIDSAQQAAWLVRFWAALGTGDTAKAAFALREGGRHIGTNDPYLHEWAIFGWRSSAFAEVERRLAERREAGGDPLGPDEDVGVTTAQLWFIRGHHARSDSAWRLIAPQLPRERREQINAARLYRQIQCGVLQGVPVGSLKRLLRERSAEYQLGMLPPDERGGTATYLAAAWAWLGDAAQARSVLAEMRSPDSLLVPFVVQGREFALLLAFLAEGRDREAIARAHLHNASPQNGGLELPLALAFDRTGSPDSVLAAGERFLGRRTFITLAADNSCAEQSLRRRMGELYEAKHDTAQALRHYRHFVATWSEPDRELRPQVAAIRTRIAALTPTPDRIR